jgi:hypothetical protein
LNIVFLLLTNVFLTYRAAVAALTYSTAILRKTSSIGREMFFRGRHTPLTSLPAFGICGTERPIKSTGVAL